MIDKVQFLNSPLNSVFGSVFFLNKKNNASFNRSDVIDICFYFDGSNIKIECDKNANGIILTCNSENLHDIDMEESGYIQALNITDFLNLESCIGVHLTDIRYVIANDKIVGLSMSFKNKKSILIVNLGDELFFLKDLPDNLKKEGYYMEQT